MKTDCLEKNILIVLAFLLTEVYLGSLSVLNMQHIYKQSIQ